MTNVCNTCGTFAVEGAKFCSVCGSKLESREHVPSAGRNREPSKFKWITQSFVVVVFLIGALTFYREAFREFHPIIAKQPTVSTSLKPNGEKIASTIITATVQGPFIIIPLNEVIEKRIVRFYDPEQKLSVPLLAYITPSGRVVTAISSSENCRSTDFYLEGENIHCASCPSYWNASSLEAYACCQKFYPDPIPSTLLGNELRIESAAARKWQPRS